MASKLVPKFYGYNKGRKRWLKIYFVNIIKSELNFWIDHGDNGCEWKWYENSNFQVNQQMDKNVNKKIQIIFTSDKTW